MNEERFVISTNEIGAIIVTDVETDRVYRYNDISNFFGLIRLLNEQQATIRKLQDLCGESDSENAKLRIENKRLQEEIKLLKPTNIEQYEQIVQLQQENEQLRKELDNFKPVIFQDMQNGTVILYFKGDD